VALRGTQLQKVNIAENFSVKGHTVLICLELDLVKSESYL